jgi:hypothetical protein
LFGEFHQAFEMVSQDKREGGDKEEEEYLASTTV